MADTGYFNPAFLQTVLPAAQAALPGYTGGSLQGYGTFNAGAPGNAPAAPPPITPVAPPAMPAPMSVQPPAPEPLMSMQPPMATQANMSVQPSVSGAPGAAAPPQSQIRLMAGTGGTPAHEVATMGPKALELNKQALKEETDANREATDMMVLAKAQQAAGADEAYGRAKQDHDAAAAVQAANQRQVAQANQAALDAVKAHSEVAPITDYWSDRTAFQRIGAGLSILAAGIGQAISGDKKDNPAAQMLQADMDRDLRTKQLRFQQQQAGAKAKVDAAQDHYNNLVRQVGMDPANDIVAASQRQMVAAEADKKAALETIPALKAGYVKAAGAMRAESDRYLAKAAIGYKQATAGTGPTVFDPAIGINVPLKQYQEYAVKRAQEDQQQQGRTDLAAMKGENKKGVQEGVQFVSKQMQQAKIPQLRETLNEAMKWQQAAGDSGTGRIARAAWAMSPMVYGSAFGEEAAAREQAFQSLANAQIKETSGGAVSDSEWSRNVAALYGARTDAARQQALDAMNASLEKAERNIYAGAGPEAAAEYKSNFQNMAPKPVDFTPKGK